MIIVDSFEIPSIDDIQDVPLDSPVKIFKVCQELQVLCEVSHGIGISAVQAGIPWKLFIVKGDGSNTLIPRHEYRYFANCEYVPVSEDQSMSLEGCLSLTSEDGTPRTFELKRFNKIHLTGTMFDFNDVGNYKKEVDVVLDITEQGIVFQHEIDHHNGILICDIGKEVSVW